LPFILQHEEPCADFTELAYKYLSKTEAERLLSTYDILPSSKDTTALWHLCSDYAYNLPVIRAAAAWPRPNKCFVYHFERGNTFRDGPPFRGLATHLLDASFHFLNLNDSLSESDQNLAIEMAGRWITFANGEDPWKPHGKERNSMCITDGGEFIVRTEKEDRERPERRWNKWDVVLDIGVEKIWKIISVYHAQFDMDEQ
jgi:carboxylesterase type B